MEVGQILKILAQKSIGYVIDKNQFYQINPLTAPAVLEAFQSYAEGKAMKEIAE